MRWCIFYTDGTTFSSEDGTPEDAPLDGIQVIADKLDGQPQYLYDRDFYFWTGDSWTHGFQRDYECWVRSVARQVKYGVVTSEENYNRILREVLNGSRSC